ncbi:MAG: sensor histidine kinase [Gemmatimonadales bacterium]
MGRAETIFWVYLLTGVVTIIFTAAVIGVIGATQKRQVEQSRRFSQGLVEAQDAERARIARELHDDVIQRVALIGGELSALGRLIPEPTDQVTQRIDGLREELHDLADEVRAMARRAHPAVLDHLGLPKSLQILASDMTTSDDLTVDVEVDPGVDLTRMTPAAALSLFRVAQEGLRNVARHAGTQAAMLRLMARDGGIALEVRDQGAGMATDGSFGRGLGLLGLTERLRAVQGTLAVASTPGTGTTITAWVPNQGRET